MLESRARLDDDAKKTEAITVKLTDTSLHFVKTRSEQLDMESPPEYIRFLIEEDQKKAAYELSLLCSSLGVKVSSGNVDSEINNPAAAQQYRAINGGLKQ